MPQKIRGGGYGSDQVGGHGGYVQRFEVIVKIQKKYGGSDLGGSGLGGGQGVYVQIFEVIMKMAKKKESGMGWGPIRGGGGVRVDVYKELKLL